MKPSVLISLFIVGAVLIAIPPFFSHLHTKEVVDLLKEGANQVTLRGGISSEYSFACWGAGALVILVGIIGAFKTT
jgi:hypothetical protein